MSRLHVERFVTFLLVVIDPTSDSVTIVNAGHMAPVVRLGTTGEIVEPGQEESGLPIAIDDGMSYEAVEFPMSVGDVAVLYTDGINEAMDNDDEEFGIDKVRELTAIGGTADEIKDRLVEAVLEHVGDAPPFDDMCLVVIERIASAGQTVADITDTADEDMLGQMADDDDTGI